MKKFLAALAGTTAFLASQSFAADMGPVMAQKDWFVKLGATYVMPDSTNVVPAVPANAIKISNAITGSVEVGRYLTDRISVSLAAGYPPTHDILSFGIKQGTVTMGAVALDAQFHLLDRGPVDIYVGGGLAYNIPFGISAPPLTRVDGGFAPVLQVGIEYAATEQMGVFLDVKKEFFTTQTYVGNAPFIKERLDPLAVTAGIAFHF
jgi:outer membrane protein W